MKILSQIQLDYRKKTQELMKKQLANDIHSKDSSPEEDKSEAELLYAEYAMDFATLAVQQALISALTALENQKSVENRESDRGKSGN